MFKIITRVCLHLIRAHIATKLNNKFTHEICLFCVIIKEMNEHHNQSWMLIALILEQREINAHKSEITPSAISVREKVMISN